MCDHSNIFITSETVEAGVDIALTLKRGKGIFQSVCINRAKLNYVSPSAFRQCHKIES